MAESKTSGKSQISKLIAAVVLLAAAVLVSVSQIDRTAGSENLVYFLDTGNQQLFTGKNTLLPPIAGPSGAEGVRAYVYSCGDCAIPGDRFIGYLLKYTDEHKQAILEDVQIPATATDLGILIGTPNGERWMPQASQEAQQLIYASQQRCPETLATCKP